MLGLLTAAPNLPFSIALALMLALAALEGVGMVLGFGFAALLDQLTPDFDLDTDAPDLAQHGVMFQFLGWLHLGKAPLLILLIVFLTAFGLLGLALQAAVQGVSGNLLPSFIASAVVLLPALLVVRHSANAVAQLLPSDESEVVSADSFIGRVATITLGSAAHDKPAQARLRDQFGQTHYVMVAPDQSEDCFAAGSEVLVVKQENHGLFRVIANPHTF